MFAVVQVFDDYGHIGRNDVECRKTFTDADEANAYIDACKAKEDSAIWDVIDYNKKYVSELPDMPKGLSNEEQKQWIKERYPKLIEIRIFLDTYKHDLESYLNKHNHDYEQLELPNYNPPKFARSAHHLCVVEIKDADDES